jgi:glycosyltransferase involved in cell wall biosynthesis
MHNLSDRTFSILRLLLTIEPGSAPYHQFSLAIADRHRVTLCSYFQASLAVPEGIALFEGDNTLRGCLRALVAAMDQGPYDVVHIHMPHIGILFLIADLCRGGALLRRAVYTVHTSYPNLRLKHKLMLVPIFLLLPRIVFCGRSSFESFPKYFWRLVGDRSCVIPNGVDIDRIDRRLARLDNEQRGARPFTVMVVGRLIALKNLLTIVQAFHRSDEELGRLVFVGEGPMRPRIASECERLGIADRVAITGLLPREQVYDHLARADLFVSASTVEGLPVAVLEAMACRCPVLLSDIPPHREIVEGTGLPFFRPDDVEGLSREMARFRQLSPSERARVGAQCRRLVEARFSLPAMHARYEGLYAQVMAGAGPANTSSRSFQEGIRHL